MSKRLGGIKRLQIQNLNVAVVVFFTLTDRASTIRGWLLIRYVVCWTEKDQRNIYQAPMRAREKHKHTKNDKEKGTGITKYTGQKKINEGHSIERVWHSASREPYDTLPGSQPCTQKNASLVASTTFRTLRVSVFTNGTIDVA